jgi:LysR family transcriptional activator of glutamate synthase operon
VDVNALRWFQQVADGVTVTEVSDLEAVTQSGVSRALARLEREVGTPLLAKSGRTLRMTRAGATLKGHLDRALHELDDGFAALAELASPDTGEISVAFQASLGTWLIPSLVQRFRSLHPLVRFDLHTLRVELNAADLASGDLDMAVTSVRTNDPAVRWRPLVLEPLALIVSPEHRLARLDSVDMRELADESFVMLRTLHGLRQTTDELCSRAGFAPRVSTQCDDLATLDALVAADSGVAVVPATPYEHDGPTAKRLVAVPISDAGASRLVGLSWSSERRLLPAARLFRDFVVAEGKA